MRKQLNFSTPYKYSFIYQIEHQRLAAQMENCKYCLDSRELAKHLIIAIGLKVCMSGYCNKHFQQSLSQLSESTLVKGNYYCSMLYVTFQRPFPIS